MREEPSPVVVLLTVAMGRWATPHSRHGGVGLLHNDVDVGGTAAVNWPRLTAEERALVFYTSPPWAC